MPAEGVPEIARSVGFVKSSVPLVTAQSDSRPWAESATFARSEYEYVPFSSPTALHASQVCAVATSIEENVTSRESSSVCHSPSPILHSTTAAASGAWAGSVKISA